MPNNHCTLFVCLFVFCRQQSFFNYLKKTCMVWSTYIMVPYVVIHFISLKLKTYVKLSSDIHKHSSLGKLLEFFLSSSWYSSCIWINQDVCFVRIARCEYCMYVPSTQTVYTLSFKMYLSSWIDIAEVREGWNNFSLIILYIQTNDKFLPVHW